VDICRFLNRTLATCETTRCEDKQMTATLHPLLRETHVSFAQATRRFPSYRGAGRCSPATAWRWVVGGVKLADGTILKLEALRLASRWVTTEEAIDRFLPALHEACAEHA